MESKSKLFGSQRLVLAFIGFFGTMNLYSMRMNLSVGILCMTNHTAENITEVYSTNSTCAIENSIKYRDGEFRWDASTRGLILGMFFWGYVATQIPAGLFILRFSVKWLVFVFMLIASISVLLLPIAARLGIGYISALRVICGLCSGVWFPCFHQLWSRWAPPAERSLLVGLTYTGLHIGNAITLPVAGMLCEYGFAGGWPSIFYLSGIFGIIWCIFWSIFIFDTPESHPRISVIEKKYIQSSLCGHIDTENPKFSNLPFKSILTSKAFWAIAIVNVTFDWNGYTFITSTPTYMKDVLKFNISQNSFLSAVPYLGMWLGQICFSFLCNILQQRKLLSVTHIRKLMTTIGMVTPAIVIVILAFLECESRYFAVVLLTIGLSATSALFVGCFVNHVDIAPQYSGLLFGMTNTMGALTGFFSAYFVGAITKNSTIVGWRIVFFVCSAIYIVGALSYLLMASGNIQSWAIQTTIETEKEKMIGEQEKEKMIDETELVKV